MGVLQLTEQGVDNGPGGVVNRQQQCELRSVFPKPSLDDLRNLIVPGFDEKESESLRLLSEAYDSNSEASFLPLQQMDSCNTRRALDDAVCAALGLDAELVSTVRRQLAAEPSVTGKRYSLSG